MAAISKAAFLKPAKPRIERVPIAEAQSNGEEAYACVRAMTARELIAERKRSGERQVDDDNLAEVYRVLAEYLCDDEGRPIFDSAEDCRENFGLSVPTLKHLFAEVFRVSGLSTTEKN